MSGNYKSYKCIKYYLNIFVQNKQSEKWLANCSSKFPRNILFLTLHTFCEVQQSPTDRFLVVSLYGFSPSIDYHKQKSFFCHNNNPFIVSTYVKLIFSPQASIQMYYLLLIDVVTQNWCSINYLKQTKSAMSLLNPLQYELMIVKKQKNQEKKKDNETNCQNIMFAVIQHSRFVDIFRRKFEQRTVCKKKKSVDFSKILAN